MGRKVYHCSNQIYEGQFLYEVEDEDQNDDSGDENDRFAVHGYGRLILASGDVYTGFFRNGQRHGFGKEIFASGEVEEGNF